MRKYLDKIFNNNTNISLEEIYFHVQYDKNVSTENRLVSRAIRKHLRLNDDEFIPGYFKVRRGKDIIADLLGVD